MMKDTVEDPPKEVRYSRGHEPLYGLQRHGYEGVSGPRGNCRSLKRHDYSDNLSTHEQRANVPRQVPSLCTESPSVEHSAANEIHRSVDAKSEFGKPGCARRYVQLRRSRVGLRVWLLQCQTTEG